MQGRIVETVQKYWLLIVRLISDQRYREKANQKLIPLLVEVCQT